MICSVNEATNLHLQAYVDMGFIDQEFISQILNGRESLAYGGLLEYREHCFPCPGKPMLAYRVYLDLCQIYHWCKSTQIYVEESKPGRV